MYNDFKGYNKSGKPVKISIPPTLLISSIGIVDKISYLTKITPDIGDELFVLDSEYEKTFGTGNNKIPTVYAKEALKTYSNYERANKLKIFNSAIGVDLGGIGVAISKMAIASKKGLIINLKSIKNSSIEEFLFSQSQSRIIVSIKKINVKKFKKIFNTSSYIKIGKCISSDTIELVDIKKIFKIKVSDLEKSYKQKIKGL